MNYQTLNIRLKKKSLIQLRESHLLRDQMSWCGEFCSARLVSNNTLTMQRNISSFLTMLSGPHSGEEKWYYCRRN